MSCSARLLEGTTIVEVGFNADNLNKCYCPDCPVQADSQCASERMPEEPFEEDNVPDPSAMAMLYCASGTSTCDDLDGLKECVCPDCAVWDEYNLNSRYYCLRGTANEIDISTD